MKKSGVLRQKIITVNTSVRSEILAQCANEWKRKDIDMAIEFKQGNILDAKENIICHQVNCRGVMGAGLAKQIREKYPTVFTRYVEL